MAGLVAGAIGTTFSGSSGGSNTPPAGTNANNANTQTTQQQPQGPSAMSSQMPILHSVIAGAVTAAALSAFKPYIEKMGDQAEDMKKKHDEEKGADNKNEPNKDKI